MKQVLTETLKKFVRVLRRERERKIEREAIRTREVKLGEIVGGRLGERERERDL